jgi:hypothetical protein
MRLPNPTDGGGNPNPISMSQILGVMQLPLKDSSFDQTELKAMGAAPVSNMSNPNSICMPYQAQATKSQGRQGVGDWHGPNSIWTNFMAATGGLNWRPSGLSEYYRAYNNKPQISGFSQGLNDGQSGSNQKCTLYLTASNSEAWSSGATPYYMWINGSGTTNPAKGVWFIPSGNQATTQTVNVVNLSPPGAGNWQVYVCDWEGCGNSKDINADIGYS